jgi:beta-galactosidase
MDRLWYGGDYNPEQWPRQVWDEDVRLMRRAGVTVATVGVFSWAQLEPANDRFEFGWLDEVLDRLHTGGIRVDLATATASPPPWLTFEHPDVLPVTGDGVRLSAGSRQQYSPSSATYRRFAGRLVRTLAERYRGHPALEAWHVNNELACHVHHDYSDESAAAFRAWLIRRYGTIEELNHAWGTAFWSQQYGSFDEIMPPRAAPATRNPTQLLDYDRFSSDAWLEVYRAEAAILREVSPGVPVTTNFLGLFKHADYWAWAREVDFVADDHYADPADPAAPAYAAMTRDLMRSLGQGRPWILMEQAASAVNWRTRNAPLPPGMHRLLSLQAIARGADGIMQFQWRQSRAGAEKFHSAMLPHGGEHTRIYAQAVALGAELAGLADIIGTTQIAPVAIVADWDSWWALEQPATPAQLSYRQILLRWHRELRARGILADFARPDSDLTPYQAVIAPATVVLTREAAQNLAEYARAGGTLVVSYQTGILDQRLHVWLDGYLGGPALREILGVHIEEFAPPAEPSSAGGPTPRLQIDGLAAGPADEWGEVIRLTAATVRATFVGGMLDGLPAITSNTTGTGTAWYVGTAPEQLGTVIEAILTRATIPWTRLPDNTETITRGPYRFTLNFNDHEATIDGVTIPALGALVQLRKRFL